MGNKKKLVLWALATIALITTSLGITWAFFNYTRTGEANVFETGNIYFESDYESVILEDVVPIDKVNVLTDTENVMAVNVSIKGYTTYKDGVDYKISARNLNLNVNDKTIPISANVTSQDIPNIQTFNFEDEMIVVENSVFAQGNIMPADGNVDGVVTVRFYIDENNILVSDTSEDATFTTEEWNNIGSLDGISIKIKVEAWEHEETLHDIMLANAVMDNVASEFVSSETGIDFSQISSNTNGRGLYMMAETANNPYPIVYYRGNVDNNNVMFGGYCWKAVRTTETGGVKLIYNGTPTDTYEKTILTEEQYNVITNNGFTYDESSDYWQMTSNSTNGLELSFTVSDASNYIVDILGNVNNGAGVTGTYAITKDSTNILNGTLNQYGAVVNNQEVGALTADNTITIKLTDAGWSLFNVRLIQKGELIGTGCDNIGSSVYIKDIAFNKKTNSLAYNGYMYNKVYEYVEEAPIENAYFANDVIYESGVYKLQNAEVGYTSSRHYTCNSVNSAGTCETIRYYLAAGRYIELTGGKKISDAIVEMTSDSDINKADSNAKVELETWYSNNLLKYANKIEDTIWCNDRSINSLGAFSTTGSSSLIYKTYSRATTKNINLKCENDVDNFSLRNRLAQINYPIGLLTLDEIKLAGIASIGVANSSYYLNSKTYYWTMSPSAFHPTISGAYGFRVDTVGNLNSNFVSLGSGLRPSISLAFGATIADGDGTVGNPYIMS